MAENEVTYIDECIDKIGDYWQRANKYRLEAWKLIAFISKLFGFVFNPIVDWLRLQLRKKF